MRVSETQTSDYPWLANYPPNVDWSADIAVQSLPDMFDAAVERFAENPCTYFLGKSMSYAEIAELTNAIATGLQAHGLKPGDKIGLLLPNCPYFIAFYFAALKIGCVVVNYNPLYTVEELEYQVKDSQTTVMVSLDLNILFDKVAELIEGKTLERAVICPFADLLPFVKGLLFKVVKRNEIANLDRASIAPALIPYEDLISKGTDYGPVHIEPLNDVAVLQYTGGTTGVPKGAMLTHANLTANVQQVTLWFPEAEDGRERVLAVLPFFHVFAMTGIMNNGLSRGYELVLMAKFELDDAVKLLKRKRPTILPGVPTLFNALMNHSKVSREDLASLKHCISGGAPLPLEVRTGFEALAGCSLVEGYGLSETSPVAAANPPGGLIKENSIGQPLPRTTISIRDLDDPAREMPLGEDGEVCISGPQVMLGYWLNEEATAATFTGKFLRTGDVGHFDGDGFIYLVDRIKDIIICSGFNVYPRRIEDAIYEFPAVDEVTVIGVPDEYRGEAPKAFIKLKDGETASEEDLLSFLKKKLSPIEMPDHFEFRDELPKTMVGKLSKKELRDDHQAGAAAG